MFDYLHYFKSTFDLFPSPFIIINVDKSGEISCDFYNNAFNYEFLNSNMDSDPDCIAREILKNITQPLANKHNFVLRLNCNNKLDNFFRVSIAKIKDGKYSATIESLDNINNSTWSNILKNNSAIVYSTKPDGDYAFNFISDNVSEILGYDASMFVRANDFWDSLIKPDFKNYVINSLHCLETSDEVRMIYPILSNDGDYRWFEERARLVRDYSGTPKEIIGLVIDVNEQKQSYDNLNKTLQELRVIMNTIPGIIIVVDKDLKILDFSDNLIEISGFESRDSIANNRISRIFLSEHLEIEDDLKLAIFNRNSVNRITNSRESYYFGSNYRILINPIIDENNNVWGAVAAMHDISDFIAKEQDLTDSIAKLEESRKSESEQTAKVRQLLEQVTESKKDLFELNNQKDKFFSVISHDLRAPLKGFMQLTKILSDELPSMDKEEIFDLTNSMFEASQNLYKLLENLLEWSKIQRGIMDYNPITMQLSTLVMMNIDLLQIVAKQKEISLNNKVHSSVLIYTDVNLLNTILRNLISNAIKFSFNGSTVTISSSLNNDDFVEICVEDSGVGMTNEEIENLYRLDKHFSNKGTSNESGSGLGLILCKDLVEINGGKIYVESEPDMGTKFYFTVPSKHF
ncbi:MAG: PAS domain S-box protein [Candidatus Kapabacteria bacterium]|nr:PAS domain S-box protein [Ignavibacteriota bacterium]MCW5883358.1 PAS domain S-box protein [Candidatus Kapabacteria bacterium]